MSSRQTGSRYMNNGGSRKGYEGGVAPVHNPGLIPSLFGQNKMSGGLVTGPDGKITFQPYQGSSGIFGGQSRINAALLNSQLGSQVMEQQHQKEMSAQEAKQAEALTTLQSQLTEHLGKSAQINAIATKLGIPVDQLTASISQELAANALQDTRNTGAALRNPDVQKSYNTGLIAGNEAQGAKNASLRAQIVPSGGVGIMPGLTGQATPTVGYGATPRQTIMPDVRNYGQGPMTMGLKTINDYTPAKASFPNLFNAAKNIQEDGSSANNGETSDAASNSALQQYINGGLTAGSIGASSPSLTMLASQADPSILTNPNTSTGNQGDQTGNGTSSIADLIALFQKLQNSLGGPIDQTQIPGMEGSVR